MSHVALLHKVHVEADAEERTHPLPLLRMLPWSVALTWAVWRMRVLQFVVLNAASLQVLYEGRDSRHWIRDVRFSPNGELFALASTDNRVSHI